MPDVFVKLMSGNESIIVKTTSPIVKVKGFGSFNANSITGKEYGDSVVLKDQSYVILRPSPAEILARMPRKAQIITLKDAAYIIGRCGIGPGSSVLEVGSGSGAMTLMLAHSVGETGRVVSLDVRQEHVDFARGTLEAAGLGLRVDFILHDITKEDNDPLVPGTDTGLFDAVVLDIPEPWEAVDAVGRALRTGGIVASYVPTAGQLERTFTAFKNDMYASPENLEIILRPWQVRERAVRPATTMLSHTAFLFFATRSPVLRSPV